MSQMGAADFKAHCLQVMEKVRRTRQEVVITKRGVPVAKLVPADPPKKFVLGALAGKFTSVGDIVGPVISPEAWEENRREWDELNAEPKPRKARR
jgi:prevent-host-death family protein